MKENKETFGPDAKDDLELCFGQAKDEQTGETGK